MKKKIIIAAGAVIAAAAVGVSAFFALKPSKEINLIDYVQCSFSGFNGFGSAKADFEETSFEANAAEISGIKQSDEKKFNNFSQELKELENKIAYDIASDRDGSLSNGDTVSVKVNFSGENNKFHGIKINSGEKEMQVQGLSDLAKADLFNAEYLTVSFSGNNGNGKCKLESNNKYASYSADKSKGLSNGDRITVSYTIEDYDAAAAEFGKIGLSVERSGKKEITVSDLSDFYKASKKDIKRFIEIFGQYKELSWKSGYNSSIATTEDIFEIFIGFMGANISVYNKYFDEVNVSFGEEDSDSVYYKIPVASYESFCRDVFNVSNPKELSREKLSYWENVMFGHSGSDTPIIEKHGEYYYFNLNSADASRLYWLKLDRYEALEDGTYNIYADEYFDNLYYEEEIYNTNIVFRAGLKDINGKKMWSVFEISEVKNTEKKFITTENLNVRSGPGENYDKVSMLPKDTEITVSGTNYDGWAKIDKDKYVYARYIEKAD